MRNWTEIETEIYYAKNHSTSNTISILHKESEEIMWFDSFEIEDMLDILNKINQAENEK